MPYKKRRPTGQLNHRAWRRLRDQVVREEPFCQLRLSGFCTIRSQTGDHIVPVSVRPDLKFVRSNVRGACHACNRRRGNLPLPVVRAQTTTPNRPPAKALEFFDPPSGRFANLEVDDESA